MGMIDDLLSAIDDYPEESVEISIVDFREPGTHINVNETCSFRVRVENNGPLDLDDLILHIESSGFTRVGRTPLAFSDVISSGRRDVDAHSSVTYGTFFMRADSATGNQGQLEEDLISVHISGFNASLQHILRDHSHHSGDPEASYNRHIHPV